MKAVTQTEAVRHIKNLLRERDLDIPSRTDGRRWVIFEREDRQIGVDTSSGVWIREGQREWRCVALPRTVSGAIQAIDFLAG